MRIILQMIFVVAMVVAFRVQHIAHGYVTSGLVGLASSAIFYRETR